jgi:hypothetical protein
MNRSCNLNHTPKLAFQEISREIAVHEAGHAVAIYLGNHEKELPPVFFQIFINPLHKKVESAEFLGTSADRCISKVKGGRLIHTLPSSLDQATRGLSAARKYTYQHAFEADIINVLAGPLAEARYVALRDNEPFNPELVNVSALQYYGGSSDLKIVDEYLACFIDNHESRERKMTELFLAAFNFVNDRRNWLAIIALADFILTNENSIIECNDIIDVIKSVVPGIAASQSLASFG